MGGDVVAGRELILDELDHAGLDALRLAPAQAKDVHAEQQVLPACDPVRERERRAAQQPGRDLVDRGPRDHVGRRALQHRHVRGLLRERGHERHRGRPAANHDDALAGVGHVVVPLLRMHDPALKALAALEGRRVALGIVVVATAHQQEAGAQLDQLATVALDLDAPLRIGRRPRGAAHAMAVADLAVDAVLVRRIAQVLQDRRSVGDRLLAGPRPERVAQRVHVRIGSDPRVAKQIPGPAERLPAFEDRDAALRAQALQMAGRADAGKTGADDQDIDEFISHGAHDSRGVEVRSLAHGMRNNGPTVNRRNAP